MAEPQTIEGLIAKDSADLAASGKAASGKNDATQGKNDPTMPSDSSRPDRSTLKAAHGRNHAAKGGRASHTDTAPKEDAAGCAKEFPNNKRGERHPVCGSP